MTERQRSDNRLALHVSTITASQPMPAEIKLYVPD
jgi:hypothetical protein